jgi:hypothetical protein
MEALLNVITQRETECDDHRTPLEIHTHDVLRGDRITLEAMGQRYLVHVAAITPESITLEVEGLRPVDEHQESLRFSPHILRRYSLPRNSSLSFSIPMMEHSPTWKIEWADAASFRHRR